METEEQTIRTVSVTVTSRWARTLHHKNLARSIGAIASLAGAVSVLVGVLATHMAPHGWRHVKIALHLMKEPLIVRLAPLIAAFAVTAATTAGLLSFYSWYRDGREQRQRANAVSEPPRP